MTLADIVCGVTLIPQFQLVLDAGFRKEMSNLTKWFEAFIALPEVVKAAGTVKVCAKSMTPPGVSVSAPKAAKKEEEVDDLFGSDDDADAEAAAAAAKAMKDKKKPKKVVIAQSLVLFEVKPLDDTTDLDEMAKRILAINDDGIYWKTQYKKEPVAFGIFKLIIGVTVEDEKVSVDGLVDKIEAFEDMVQSVEIVAFNKI